LLKRVFGFLTKLLLGFIFYATPLVGIWLASSLEAYLGGPAWMAWTAGALLFPIIPGLWELHAWAYRKPDSKPWLTTLDRLSLKTFVVGLAFVCGLLSFYPQVAFLALSTRGDWMLDEVKDPRTERARRMLFAAAGGLEWLYRATKSNPYIAQIDSEAIHSTNQATQQRESAEEKHEQEVAKTNEQDVDQQKEVEVSKEQSQESNQTDTVDSTDKNNETIADKDAQKENPPSKKDIAEKDKQESAPESRFSKKWPWKGVTLHPVVATMPASVETSIKSVAQYIAKREKDPVLRIKALHDYVADRIAYDTVALYSGNFPSQSARTVFETRKGVCAGYANLLTALASAINEKVVVVVGDARDAENSDKLAGGGHAWNAARINGRWYLIDVCWDAGSVTRETGFTKKYKTEYLLTPPEVMIQSHFPDQVTWQLLDEPISLGDFLRKPMLDPSFQAADLTLVRPTRAINETDSNAVVIVKNPDLYWLMVGLEQNGKKVGSGSYATKSKYAKLERPLPGKGKYRLNIFANEKDEYSQYTFVGAVDFVRR
jgi:hypothetical protein